MATDNDETPQPFPEVRESAEFWAEVGKLLPASAYDSVPGDVACGLAFDLGAERAKTEGQLRPLIDELLESGGQATPLAIELARAADLEIDAEAALDSFSDEELLAEARRRGWMQRIEGQAGYRGLESTLRPGEVFGDQRSGMNRLRVWAPHGAVDLGPIRDELRTIDLSYVRERAMAQGRCGYCFLEISDRDCHCSQYVGASGVSIPSVPVDEPGD